MPIALHRGPLLEIWPTGAGNYQDYSAHLLHSQPVQKRHRLNEPQELTLDLIDAFGMTVPEAGNRIRVSTTTYANWFTGHILRTPQRAPLAKDPVTELPVYGYRIQAASEEIRLEWKTASIFPTLPPFANKYQGEIISELIGLLGGGFDTSGVDDGILIPYFRIKPDEGFFDVVRRLSDRTNMSFWTSRGVAYYRPFQLFYNTGFESWATGVPRGWTSDGSAGLSEETTIVVAGSAGKITGNGVTAVRGRIYQDATPFIRANKAYSLKIRLRKTSSLAAGTFVVDLSGTGISEQFKVLPSSMSTAWQTFSGQLTVGITSIPSDLRLRVFLENTPTNNESAYFDELMIYETWAAWLVGADESLVSFNPFDLSVTPVQNAVFNDVVAVGEIEPQAYVREYFIGDGFSAAFPLRFPMFGAQSSRLLEDDFTATQIDATRWIETDPNSLISVAANSLLFQGGPVGVPSRMTAVQGLEICDVLELRAGRVRFNDESNCILGGVYSADTGALADCVAGFRITPATGTGQCNIRSIVNCALAGSSYSTLAGKTYQLTLTIICASHVRRRRPFFSRLNKFGGEDISAQATLEFSVIELPDNDADSPTQVLQHSAVVAGIPAFLFYTLLSGPGNATDAIDLQLNFTLLRKPLVAALWTRKTTDAGYILQKLGDKADPEARASIVQGAEGPQLTFFSDKLPEEQEKIKVFYRASGQARVRVRKDASVTAEAAKAGDSGVRAGTLPPMNPAPRDSAELEAAIQAYIEDHTTPAMQGDWSHDSRSYPSADEPVPGRMIFVDTPTRHAPFLALAHGIDSEFLLQDAEDSSDVIQHAVSFGSVSRLEQEQANLGPAENALEGPLDSLVDVPQVEFDDVGTQFAADRPDAEFDGTLTSSTIRLDTGAAPASEYEVRKFDGGWATAQTLNKIVATNPTTQTFTIPRTSRDILAFLKNKDGAGLVSRYPSAVRVVYPLVPPQVDALAVTHKTAPGEKSSYLLEASIAESKIADFYQLELRDEDNSTVLVRLGFDSLSYENGYYVGRYTFDNSTALDRSRTFYAYQRNLLGEYSASRSGTGLKAEPAKPFLTAGNSVGQIIEVLLDQTTAAAEILETQIQVDGSGTGWNPPDADAKLQSQPEKFSFTAPHSGAWSFRARRRDAIGWSPWSSENQGQVGAQVLVFAVTFFSAPNLDPSIGAAINQQNLLANPEFFIGGIGGQEGANSAKYFALVNALADGTEVQWQGNENEMKWKSGVNFASSNPGFASLYTNLGRLFNPGESLSLSFALRHDGGTTFAKAITIALRSAGTPSYDQTKTIAANTVTSTYGWYSAVFALPTGSAVPDDLSVQITVGVTSGNSIASDLFCDKVILNRGQRPAAFSLSIWDTLALTWNGGASAYDLPATAVAATARATDPGSAGTLVGTGTEDLDGTFQGRYHRET